MCASFVLTVSSLREKGVGVGGYPKNVRKHCINRLSVASKKKKKKKGGGGLYPEHAFMSCIVFDYNKRCVQPYVFSSDIKTSVAD